MHVLLIQVDGKLPNLALMKLSHWHRSQGHTVTLTKRRPRDLFDPSYDNVKNEQELIQKVEELEKTNQDLENLK
jgi:hypothetical protein